jgi:outer membrane protein assembly factor BamB
LRAPGGEAVTPAGVVTARGAVWVWGPSGAVRIDAGRDRIALDVPVGGGDVRGFGTDGDRVWMATESGHLLSFDARTGARTASFRIPPTSRQRTVAALGDVVVLDRQDGTIEGIDARTGRQRWRTPVGPAVSAATLAGDVLWVTAQKPVGTGESLLEIDPHSGRIAERTALPAERTRAIAVAGTDVWITTDAGDVIVVRRSG